MPPSGAAEKVDERDLIPLSALQHMVYCPRQCALIHNERQWAENLQTAEGRILHDKVDGGDKETRKGVVTARSVSLRSVALGVAGVADAVEIHEDGTPYPVEYKRGRPKAHRADEVQLCAQALCLEEMLDTSVPEGALYYGLPRRRKAVVFDAELRALTEEVAKQTYTLIRSGDTPPPAYDERKCAACSLLDVCQPQPIAANNGQVADWLAKEIGARP